ncbi:MAG: GNAT family N-acetyltransferase [Clostridia bacterium]|nr:GNAT family N-acetyltransferase [Clostridia bacterium]
MFSLDIQNDTVYFKDIKPADLPLILNWYNKVDDFKFATGIDTPISLEKLTRKYAEVAICRSEFFAGIYLKGINKLIGIVKGSLKYRESDSVWISSLAIDTDYQNNGYGTMVIELLLKHLKLNNNINCAYLAVVEENIQGRNFWVKQKFQTLRKMEGHLTIQDRPQNVIIMHKKF